MPILHCNNSVHIFSIVNPGGSIWSYGVVVGLFVGSYVGLCVGLVVEKTVGLSVGVCVGLFDGC